MKQTRYILTFALFSAVAVCGQPKSPPAATGGSTGGGGQIVVPPPMQPWSSTPLSMGSPGNFQGIKKSVPPIVINNGKLGLRPGPWVSGHPQPIFFFGNTVTSGAKLTSSDPSPLPSQVGIPQSIPGGPNGKVITLFSAPKSYSDGLVRDQNITLTYTVQTVNGPFSLKVKVTIVKTTPSKAITQTPGGGGVQPLPPLPPQPKGVPAPQRKRTGVWLDVLMEGVFVRENRIGIRAKQVYRWKSAYRR